MSTRAKIISSMMLLIGTVCIFFIFLLSLSQQRALEAIIDAKAESATLLSENVLLQTSDRYSSRIKGFINYTSAETKEEFINAFAHQDRYKLLSYTHPFLEIFQKENPFFLSLGWILPENKVLLRVQDPDFFGDDVTQIRPDIAEANASQKQVTGFDVSYSGMQYRIVQPVEYKGRHLGVVQFGIKGDFIPDSLRKKLHVPAGLAITNEEAAVLTEKDCPSFKGKNHTIISKDSSLFDLLPKDIDWNKRQQNFNRDGRHYVLLNILPIQDYIGNLLGSYFIVFDITAEWQVYTTLMSAAFVICLLLLIPCFLIIYFSYGKLVQKIVNLNSTLEEQNADLENRIADRTKVLEKEIEERKKIQKQVSQAKMEWERTFDAVPDQIAIIDSTFKIIRANRAMAIFHNCSLDEIIGKQCFEIMHASTSPVAECPHGRVLQDKITHASELYEENFKTHLYVSASPLFSDEGDFIGSVHVARDVTQIRKAEQKQLEVEAKLQKSEKMEAIGLMAGGVAHDLNNILSGITGYPDILLLELPPESTMRQPLEAIQKAGHKAAAVVSDLLTVARGAAITKKEYNLNDLISEYLKSPEGMKLLGEHPDTVITCDLAPDLNPILCSSIHIQKTIMNLVLNAIEALKEPGTISLTTRNITSDNGAELVQLEVKDTGDGIPEEQLEHIFEPFYSTKIMGHSGTGLGLSVVWNTVQDHKANITVHSDSDGTVFTIEFPAIATSLAQKSNPGNNKKEEENLNGTNSILVVDDGRQQRDVATQMLSLFGYDVHCAESGEDAIELVKKRSYDLIVLDMLMDPGINGRETYRQIVAIHPGQKAIITTGFSESEDVKATLELGASGFIKKPYSMDQLGRAIKEALQS